MHLSSASASWAPHLRQQPGEQLLVEGVRQAQQLAAAAASQQAAKDILRHALARVQALPRACAGLREPRSDCDAEKLNLLTWIAG